MPTKDLFASYIVLETFFSLPWRLQVGAKLLTDLRIISRGIINSRDVDNFSSDFSMEATFSDNLYTQGWFEIQFSLLQIRNSARRNIKLIKLFNCCLINSKLMLIEILIDKNMWIDRPNWTINVKW